MIADRAKEARIAELERELSITKLYGKSGGA